MSSIELARYGFRAPARAARELPDRWSSDVRWRHLLAKFAVVADPDGALRRVSRLGPEVLEAMLARPERAAPVLHALGFSDYVADLLVRVPGLAADLVLEDGLGPNRLDRDGGDQTAPPYPPQKLRELKDAGMARIAVRDLSSPPTRASFEETGRALSDLCDACLRRALEIAGAPSGLAVMAMGKYGGRELNYSSDIDVLFVAGRDVEESGAAALRVMGVMNGPPTIHRTDADLRPEGRDGPLVRSLESYRAYYARWAQVWEFQALIKCRFAAGDEDVGAAFIELVRPSVWPERLAPEAIEHIRALKARAEREVERRGLSGRQVKLAPGGIRDVEFAVQLLQLVHGRHHPELRVRSTLEALDTLGEGFVAEPDAAELADAYVFLRHAEHRLQLALGRQTHTLPERPEAREHLARGMFYRGAALEQFERDWKRRTSTVRQLHEKLFFRPLLEAFAAAPAFPAEEARERLAALGFDRPARAQDAIVALTSGASRAAKVMKAILPAMLGWLADSPDPDGGLLRLQDFARDLRARSHLLARLRDEPPVAELLSRALGTGLVLAELLERDPAIVASLDASSAPDRSSLVREAVSIVSRATEATPALRRFKETVWLGCAVRDLAAAGDARSAGRAGRSDAASFLAVSRDLSHLADACLEAALHAARAEVARRTGGPPDGGFAIVGMGRLGGEELSYASDLDVMFVYEGDAACPDGSEGRLFHSLVAERIRELLGTVPPVFRVDADLRPDGRNGPIVRSLAGYLQYYERWAATWEFQALTRARHAAGDGRVTGRLLDGVTGRVWPEQLSADQIREIRHMKARIERERVKARQDPHLQLKLGIGGLADVEFTVQLLQMRHGAAHPQVRTPNTYRGIEALQAAGLIEERDAERLRDAYVLLNRVRNHLFLLRGVPTDVLPARDDELERLARSLGYGRLGRSALLEDYRRVTRRARRVCDRLFYGEE